MIISNTLQDIATLLLAHSVELREQLLHEELDRVTIYRSHCWDILTELQPTNFDCPMTGGWARNPEQLVWGHLYELFYEQYGILLTE